MNKLCKICKRTHGAYREDGACIYCSMARIRYLDPIKKLKEIIKNAEEKIRLIKIEYKGFDKVDRR